MMTKAEHCLEVVLKATERCNINCTYCYVFNKGNDSYLSKPKRMSARTASEIGMFVRRSAEASDIASVRFIFHGGEPLMLSKSEFRAVCDALIEGVGNAIKVGFTIQTNAMLVDEEWIDILSHYRFGVGVSLDGPREINDLTRVDHKGQGTYDRVLVGIRKLQAAAQVGKLSRPGVLCVINPRLDGAEMLRHFVLDLDFRFIDFLLPMDSWDTASPDAAVGTGRFLVSAFDAWVALGRKDVEIRFFERFYEFLGGVQRTASRKALRNRTHTIITATTNGDYGPDDGMLVTSDVEFFSHNVQSSVLSSYFDHPLIRELSDAALRPPSECSGCSWVGYCRGGSANGRLINRYKGGEGFRRKSVLCDGLRLAYAHIASHLLDIGFPRERMIRHLESRALQSIAYAELTEA